MERFSASAVTHLLVVSDLEASRDWHLEVLDASVHGEYGGTSVVLRLLDTWLLLVTGGGPTPDKPSVSLAPPADPDRVSAERGGAGLAGAQPGPTQGAAPVRSHRRTERVTRVVGEPKKPVPESTGPRQP